MQAQFSRLVKDKLNFEEAVTYHYGKFPPSELNYAQLARQIGAASSAVARYDGVLRSLKNSEILLAPLRRKEAVISSRIEGTVTTLDEVFQYEAESQRDQAVNYRHEVAEAYSYARAMNHAQQLVVEGLPICGRLIRSAHSKLLLNVRGADKQPGEYKREQNYIVDQGRKKVLFVPISADKLGDGISQLERFIHDDKVEPLIQTALTHLEFEALHPFKDGNGRVGRMLITLMLWNKGIISAPHFYVSAYLERHKDRYIDLMRNVSQKGEWTEWCEFFLGAIAAQAQENLETAEKIRDLYDEMRGQFIAALNSKWSTLALDFVFERPVFRTSQFTSAGLPKPSAQRFLRALQEKELLRMVYPGSGRRPAVMAFEPLLELVRE
ncbi:MAG: Fic family protein [Aestuariivirga sp.]|uniref:Fic family protein n=1 Tax=Aestuariivirga sp. TaxID=2650926 RepID=UPI0025C30AE7|nr:Fic/DOC family N-terminal domain-containing protein [Aestuariivirga sp.]MCA3562432.1 Fic family protein [Aestuariivirga sp.]